MYGAILGDMIGSPYEFDRGNKTKDFPLFSGESRFTDDTVMTVAVADALLRVSPADEDSAVCDALIDAMHDWGRKYPDAGYGGMFYRWLFTGSRTPYGSFGNGSAMRVSSAGWLYDDLETTRRIARLTAAVTHNHPEGLKGAEATASAIFLARSGKSKEEIRDFVVREFGYDLSRTCDEIRPAYRHVETCRQTVPEAITAFLEGNGFEDVIRTAVSLGGDCDTLTCIAGSVAEAFYGVPLLYEAECRARLPEDMAQVLDRFDAARGRVAPETEDPALDGNALIEDAVRRHYKEWSRASYAAVLEAIRERLLQGGTLVLPVLPPQAALDMLDPTRVRIGDTVTSEEDLHFKLRRVTTKDGKEWLAAFTSYGELEKGESSSSVCDTIESVFSGLGETDAEGLILNPWDRPFPEKRD